ncbi:PD40 domain-containing protein [bacterium]|nr:PD40 domain-containing protein [bacterium]
MTKYATRLLLAAAMAALVPAHAGALERAIYLLSQTARGYAAEGRSEGTAVDGNGLLSVYNSNAINLTSPPQTTSRNQVYLRDLDETASSLVSKAPDGKAGNRPSQSGGFAPGISADGRFVAFSSQATNLVPDDTNGLEDVFVANVATGEVELISRGIDGPANGVSGFPRLSADGRYVVFQSAARNLVADDTNNVTDIFLYDRAEGIMRRVSVGSDGAQANGASITPAISDDGRYVAFASRATNLVNPSPSDAFEQIYVADWETQSVQLGSVNDQGQAANARSFLPDLTADGGEVAFKSEAFNLVPNDTNGVPDVFVRNLTTNTTQRVSVDDFGNQSNGLSGGPGISADGRFVAFASFASNFVPDDGNGFSDVYVYDRFPPGRNQGRIARVTIAYNNFGEPDQGVADFPVSISADGRWIGFASAASNLVPNDLNNDLDAFLACNPFDAFQCAAPTPTPTPTEPPAELPCVGDCSGDDQVTIDDLIRMVNIALGLRGVCGDDQGMGACLAGDANCDCQITVEEIIQAVNNSLMGCATFDVCPLAEHEMICCAGGPATPTATRTATMTPDGGAPTATATPTPPATPTATTSGPSGPCVGDCNGNGTVTVDDLIRMVNIALDLQPLCPGEGGGGCLAGDANCDCRITVDDIIRAVNNSLGDTCTDFGACQLSEHAAQCCG